MNKLFYLLLPVSLLSASALANPPAHFHHGVRLNVMDIMVNCDTDKNMVLDERELAAYKQSVDKYTNEVKASLKSFSDLDVNKDNFISFDEFLTLPKVAKVPGLKGPFHHHHGPHGHHMPPPPPYGAHGHHMPPPPPQGAHGHHMPPPPPQGAHGHHMPPPSPHGAHGHHGVPIPNMKEFRAFNRFDADHDGKLSKDEYSVFLDVRTVKNDKLKALVAGMDFRVMDLNKDGGVSPKEMEVYVKARRLADAPSYKDLPKPPKHDGR